MLGPPVDSVALWVALSVVSLVFLGVAVDSPTTPPPDATALANTIDTVAASDHPTRAAHPVGGDAKVSQYRVSLRNGAGTAHVSLAFGPVTPAPPDGPLRRVLLGEPPSRVFERPAAFGQAVERANNRTPRWQHAHDSVLVRHVFWEGMDVTLVGA